MKEKLTLIARTEYHIGYPPNGAKKAYVARITGRQKGPTKYCREFLGDSVDLLADDTGLYEVQHALKKGGYRRYYYVVLNHPEHGMIRSTDAEEHLAALTKLLDKGHPIEDIVDVQDLRPSNRDPSLMVFDAIVRTPTARDIASTVEKCLTLLRGLSEPDRFEALEQITKVVHNGAS